MLLDRPLLVVLRALGLGDLLAAVPAFRALAAAFPGYRRVLAAPAALAPVARWTGAIDAVADTAPLAPLPSELHGAAFAFNLHGCGPQSTALLAATRPQRLVAFGRDAVWDDDEHERDRWCRLLRAAGIPADPTLVGVTAPGPVTATGATIVHPGAARPAVRWPPDRFAAVAAAERRAGRPVLVTGSAAEVDLAAAVARAAGLAPDAVLAGRTDLDDLARLVAGAACVVSADTGIAHLAVALATPTVTVFGPVTPHHWGPPPLPRHRVLWSGPDPAAVTVDDVLTELAMLNRWSRPPPASPTSGA